MCSSGALTPLGFAVTRLRFEGNGSYPVDNLFATRGSGTARICCSTAIPTSCRRATAALWTHDPFGAEIVDGVLYGRGAADMKSGIAAFVAALAEAPADARISLAITNDEEADGVNGTARILEWAAAQGHRFDFAIVGEPSATASGRRLDQDRPARLAQRRDHRHRRPGPRRLSAQGAQPAAGRRRAGRRALRARSTTAASTSRRPISNSPRSMSATRSRTSFQRRSTLRFNVRFNDAGRPRASKRRSARGSAAVDDEGATIALRGRRHALALVPVADLAARSRLLATVIAAATGARRSSRPPAAPRTRASSRNIARWSSSACPARPCTRPTKACRSPTSRALSGALCGVSSRAISAAEALSASRACRRRPGALYMLRASPSASRSDPWRSNRHSSKS